MGFDDLHTLADRLNFGQYEGHTVRWVMENDNAYFVWLCDNGFEYDE